MHKIRPFLLLLTISIRVRECDPNSDKFSPYLIRLDMYLHNYLPTPAKSHELKRQEIQQMADMEYMFYMIS